MPVLSPGLALWVRADSGVTDFAGLEGKSFIIGKGSFGASEAEKNFETFGVAGKVNLVDVELGSAVPALKNGQVDAANIFSTDPAISANGFVPLEDTKKLFGSQNIVPLVRTDRAGGDVRTGMGTPDALSCARAETLARTISPYRPGATTDLAEPMVTDFDLAALLGTTGAHAESADLLRESIAMRLRLLGEDHMGVAVSTSNLAVTLYSAGDLEGAVGAGEDALERFQRILGPDHQRTMMAETNLAAMYGARGDNEAAAGEHRRILERRRRLFGERHASVATSMMMLANTLAPLDRLDEAERLAAGAVEIQREAMGPLAGLGDIFGAD